MRLTYDHSSEVAAWVGWRIPLTARRLARDPACAPFGPAYAIGVVNDADALIAGAVFHGWDPDLRSIEVSCAASSKVWARREIVSAILRYAFVDANCQRCSAVTPRRATSPRRFLEGLGFRREGSLRRGFLDDNAIIYGLLVEDWRAGKFGPESASVVSHEQEGRLIGSAAT